MLLAFTVQRRMDEHKMCLLDRPILMWMIILDVLGILLVMVSAFYIGSLVSRVVSLFVYNALVQPSPQWLSW
jgi:hypothetical protein